MALADRIVRGFKATLIGQIIFTLSNAALLIALTRYLLTPEQYGLFNLGLSVMGVAAIFGTLGLPKSTARYVTEYAESDPGQVPHILTRMLKILLGLAIVVSIALGVLSGPISNLIGEPDLVPLLVVGVGYITVRALYGYFNVIFQGFNEVTWSAVMRVISSLSRLFVAVGLALLGFGALGVVAGYVAGFAFAAAFGIVVLYTKFYSKFDRSESAEDGLSRRILEYSVPLTATRGANVLDKKVDMILVGALINATAVSYYALAKQIANFTSMPAASLGFTISPALAEQEAGDHPSKAAQLYEESLEHVLLLYIPAVVGLVLVARPTVRLVFGAKYIDAVPVIQVFAGFILVRAVNTVTSGGLDYLGRARIRAIVKGATAVANFLLNLLLIPIFGVLGAAIATVITFSVYTVINVYYIHQELSIQVDKLVARIGRICAISVAMGVSVGTVLPQVSGLPSLAAVVLLGVVVWGSLATASGLLDIRKVITYLV